MQGHAQLHRAAADRSCPSLRRRWTIADRMNMTTRMDCPEALIYVILKNYSHAYVILKDWSRACRVSKISFMQEHVRIYRAAADRNRPSLRRKWPISVFRMLCKLLRELTCQKLQFT